MRLLYIFINGWIELALISDVDAERADFLEKRFEKNARAQRRRVELKRLTRVLCVSFIRCID